MASRRTSAEDEQNEKVDDNDDNNNDVPLFDLGNNTGRIASSVVFDSSRNIRMQSVGKSNSTAHRGLHVPVPTNSASFDSTSTLGQESAAAGGGTATPPTSFSSSSRTHHGRRLRRRKPPPLSLPLSMRLMKHVSGLCCIDCSAKQQQNGETGPLPEEEHAELCKLLNYDLQALYCAPLGQRSAASPLVLAPMTMSVVTEEEAADEPEALEGDGDAGDENTDNSTTFESTDRNNLANASSPALMLTTTATTTTTTEQQQQLRTSSAAEDESLEQEQVNQLMGLPSPLNTPRVSQLVPISLVETILSDYIAACRFYGCGDRINAGVMTTLRFSLPCMRVVGRFHDSDMLALAEILFKYVNGPLRYIRRLDFSLSGKQAPPRWSGPHTSKGMHSHGALTLAKVLQMSKYIQEVFLQRNRIGPYGASAIFIACSTNKSIQRLNLRRCRVSERGALVFAELVVPSATTGLQEVDLSANYIGVRGSMAIEQALMDRINNVDNHKEPLPDMTVDLEGNHVLQEVMNAVTHGLGILLAAAGTYLMVKRVSNHSDYRHRVSCGVYSLSLIVLYTSSTLYHSFFSMQETKYIFEVFDKCAIYILIAGSYTPFLQIVLSHQPIWSVGLLAFIWCCCCLGITVEASCPTWEHKMKFSLAMYLGMGWSALVCLPEIATLVPESCINIMVLGGVGYTSGVPFFVRNNNLDHAVWHLFVLAGSIFHWCGVYFYIIDFVLPEDYGMEEEALQSVNASSSLNETCPG